MQNTDPIDAVLNSPKLHADLGFEPVNAPTTYTKTVTIAGQRITVTDSPNDDMPHITVRMPETPTLNCKDITHNHAQGKIFWYHDRPRAEAYAEAMEWADRTAHAYAVFKDALFALGYGPDAVCDEMDSEHHVVAAKFGEGRQIIDITATMTIDEMGATMGGEVAVGDRLYRSELRTCFRAGEAWLAVYDVEEVE